MRRSWRSLRLIVVAGLIAGSGCIPIPIPYPVLPGYDGDYRQNLGSKVPDFVVVGQTSREIVLEQLGEPDATYDEGSRFSYSSLYRHAGAGVAVVLVGPGALGDAGSADRENFTSNQLMIEFDANGVVSDAKMTSSTSPSWHAHSDR